MNTAMIEIYLSIGRYELKYFEDTFTWGQNFRVENDSHHKALLAWFEDIHKTEDFPASEWDTLKDYVDEAIEALKVGNSFSSERSFFDPPSVILNVMPLEEDKATHLIIDIQDMDDDFAIKVAEVEYFDKYRAEIPLHRGGALTTYSRWLQSVDVVKTNQRHFKPALDMFFTDIPRQLSWCGNYTRSGNWVLDVTTEEVLPKKPKDLHQATADALSQILGISLTRDQGKSINHGLVYGKRHFNDV